MTTKYLVFAGDVHYPSGGWGDLYGAYPTLAEATAAAECAVTEPAGKERGYSWAEDPWEWAQVVSLTSLAVVSKHAQTEEGKKG